MCSCLKGAKGPGKEEAEKILLVAFKSTECPWCYAPAPLTVSRHGAICVSALVSELPDALHLIIKLSTSRLLAQKKADRNSN